MEKRNDDILKVKILEPMDLSGRPSGRLEQVGNTGVTPRSKNPAWGSVYSVNGICCTITHKAPPIILVCNEVETNTEPEVIEIIHREPNPLW